ncbi:hypothetical protein ACSBR2_033825 [Camellia fascicularis]
MGYLFCATGSMGFKNNLPLEEIVEQLVHASHLSQLCNVVFMIAASPQTCPANIGKGCGDDWEGEFFPGIPKIKYESPSSKSPLAFKWYNAEEEILGKKMSVFPFSLLSLSPLSQLLLLFLLLRISIPKFISGFSCSSCSLSSVHIFYAVAKKKTFSQLQWRKRSKRPCIMLLNGLWRSGGMAQISIQTLVVGLQYRYYQSFLEATLYGDLP